MTGRGRSNGSAFTRSGDPVTLTVACERCERASAYATVPSDADVVDDPERGDGKVWANCHACDETFLVHFRHDR